MQERVELIVSLYSMKQAKPLKRFGDVSYVSNRMHYVVLYVNKQNLKKTLSELKKMKLVSRVMVSKTPELAEQFRDETDSDDEDEGETFLP